MTKKSGETTAERHERGLSQTSQLSGGHGAGFRSQQRLRTLHAPSFTTPRPFQRQKGVKSRTRDSTPRLRTPTYTFRSSGATFASRFRESYRKNCRAMLSADLAARGRAPL